MNRINNDAENDKHPLFLKSQDHFKSDSDDGAAENTPQLSKKYTLGIYMWLIAVTVLECVSVACAQALGGVIPHLELNLWRYSAQMTLVLPAIIVKHINVLPEKGYTLWIGCRCVANNITNIGLFTSTLYLAIGTTEGLESSTVLILAAIVGGIILRECQFHVAFAVMVCVTGIILVSQPDFIFQGILAVESSSYGYHPLCTSEAQTFYNSTTNDSSSSFNRTVTDTPTEPDQVTGYLLITGAAVAKVISFFITNRTMKDLNPFISLFWIGLSGIGLSLVGMLLFETVSTPSSLRCWMLLLGHAFTTSMFTFSVEVLLRKVNPLVFALINSSKVAIAFLFQYFIMKNINRGAYNDVEVIGAVLLLIGNIIGPAFKYYSQWKNKSQLTS